MKTASESGSYTGDDAFAARYIQPEELGLGDEPSLYNSKTTTPIDGWEELIPGDNVKYLKAIRGNTYIVWTWDNHFAKIRISEIFDDHIEFDWAYQTAEGNVELKINRNPGERVLPDKVIINRTTTD